MYFSWVTLGMGAVYLAIGNPYHSIATIVWIFVVQSLTLTNAVGLRPVRDGSTSARGVDMTNRMIPLTLAGALAMVAGAAIADSGPRLGLPPLEVPADNPVTAAKVKLGDKLFHDTRFSSTGTVAWGLIARNSGVSCSRSRRLISTVGISSPFSAMNIRTRFGDGAVLQS